MIWNDTWRKVQLKLHQRENGKCNVNNERESRCNVLLYQTRYSLPCQFDICVYRCQLGVATDKRNSGLWTSSLCGSKIVGTRSDICAMTTTKLPLFLSPSWTVAVRNKTSIRDFQTSKAAYRLRLSCFLERHYALAPNFVRSLPCGQSQRHTYCVLACLRYVKVCGIPDRVRCWSDIPCVKDLPKVLVVVWRMADSRRWTDGTCDPSTLLWRH